MNLHHLTLLASECFTFTITTGTPIGLVRFGFLEILDVCACERDKIACPFQFVEWCFNGLERAHNIANVLFFQELSIAAAFACAPGRLQSLFLGHHLRRGIRIIEVPKRKPSSAGYLRVRSTGDLRSQRSDSRVLFLPGILFRIACRLRHGTACEHTAQTRRHRKACSNPAGTHASAIGQSGKRNLGNPAGHPVSILCFAFRKLRSRSVLDLSAEDHV
jgi:hypothetical protein